MKQSSRSPLYPASPPHACTHSIVASPPHRAADESSKNPASSRPSLHPSMPSSPLGRDPTTSDYPPRTAPECPPSSSSTAGQHSSVPPSPFPSTRTIATVESHSRFAPFSSNASNWVPTLPASSLTPPSSPRHWGSYRAAAAMGASPCLVLGC
jgi:hypothetical protein